MISDSLPATDRLARRKIALSFVLLIGVLSFFADFTYEGSRSILGPYLARAAPLLDLFLRQPPFRAFGTEGVRPLTLDPRLKELAHRHQRLREKLVYPLVVRVAGDALFEPRPRLWIHLTPEACRTQVDFQRRKREW